jgi:hypothetical protein
VGGGGTPSEPKSLRGDDEEEDEDEEEGEVTSPPHFPPPEVLPSFVDFFDRQVGIFVGSSRSKRPWMETGSSTSLLS